MRNVLEWLVYEGPSYLCVVVLRWGQIVDLLFEMISGKRSLGVDK